MKVESSNIKQRSGKIFLLRVNWFPKVTFGSIQ